MSNQEVTHALITRIYKNEMGEVVVDLAQAERNVLVPMSKGVTAASLVGWTFNQDDWNRVARHNHPD